jgi:hypothetical protein
MRKYISYILILVALVGLFGQVSIKKVYADDPTGTCNYNNPGETPDVNSTQNTCAKTPGATFTADQLGKCTVSGVLQNGDWARTNCMQQGSDASWVGYYNLLAPLPGVGTVFDPTSTPGQPSTSLGKYLNPMIAVFIGICAVLAVIMIIAGGIKYMVSELPASKGDGKDMITNAVFGLLLALGAWLLLDTINPDLLKSDLNVPDATATVTLSSDSNSIYTKPAADSARCTPFTSGDCSVSNLNNTFGSRATAMSKICNIESSGAANNVSTTDIGTDKQAFSFGLFQINLLANGSKVTGTNGESCTNLFVRSDNSTISGNNYIKKDSNGHYSYDAKVDPNKQAAYNDCKAALLNPTTNIQVASKLTSSNNSLSAWKYSDSGVCPSAFN